MRAHRRHWTGRLLAESASSVATWFVTLTYGGGDHSAAVVLDYRHVQKSLDRLRRKYDFKYCVVGEHGGERDRAHWHAIIFWESEPPGWPLGQRIASKEYAIEGVAVENKEAGRFWPHGFLQCEIPRSQSGVSAYLLGYLKKPGWAKEPIRYSRGRSMGEPYLKTYAREHARAGLKLWASHPFGYFTVDGAVMTKPTRRMLEAGFRGPLPLYRYDLQKDQPLVATMADAYLEQWAAVRPHQSLPGVHPWVQDRIDLLECGDAECSDQLREFLREDIEPPEKGWMKVTESTEFPGLSWQQWPDGLFKVTAFLERNKIWHGLILAETVEAIQCGDLRGLPLHVRVDLRRHKHWIEAQQRARRLIGA